MPSTILLQKDIHRKKYRNPELRSVNCILEFYATFELKKAKKFYCIGFICIFNNMA